MSADAQPATRTRPPSARTTLEVGACGEGAQRGTLAGHADMWPSTGQPFTCTFDLIVRALYQGSAALSFEGASRTQPAACGLPALLIVTPLTSGQAVAVEETATGVIADHGVLLEDSTP